MIATAHQDLHQWFDNFYRPRKLLGKQPNTIRLYRQFLDRFTEFTLAQLGRRPSVTDLNEDVGCAFLAARLEEGLSAYTVAKERSQFIAMANHAAKKKFIADFVDIPLIDCPELTPEAYQLDQLHSLLDACAGTRGCVGETPADDWWTGLHYVFLFTGERTEATLLTRWDWLDWNTGWLNVHASVRKGKKKSEAYLLPPKVLDKLRPLRGVTKDVIFENPWSNAHKSGTFYYHYTKLLRRAGLPEGSKWKPQRLRRTFASYLEAAGGDATDALGHSSRRVTKKSYLDPRICTKVAPSSFVDGAYGLM